MNTISNVYPNIKGLFKCDDDIIINFKSIIQFINIINQKQHIIDYAGKVVQLPYIEDNSEHLKQFKKINIESFSTPESIYCGGPLYYLSNEALKCFKNINETYIANIYYEDLLVGHILNTKNIYPINYALYTDHNDKINDSSYHNSKHKKTIYMRIHGGLGNQMFQVAYGYGMALKHNMNVMIVNSSHTSPRSFTHISNNNKIVNTFFKDFPIIDARYINLNAIKHFKQPDQDCFEYKEYDIFNEDIYLDGYFQNEKYFINSLQFYNNDKLNKKSCKGAIIESFKNNNVYSTFLQNHINDVQNQYFIHVRRGDYLKTPQFYVIDYDKYYSLAIEHIMTKDPDATFCIFSDDIEYCKTYHVFNNINKTFLDYDDFLTIYAMSLCSKGGICCNSTFSWWGSFMNENPDKIVTMPSRWLNNDWQNDVFYENVVIINI